MENKIVEGRIGDNIKQVSILGYRLDLHNSQVETAMNHLKKIFKSEGYNPDDVIFKMIDF